MFFLCTLKNKTEKSFRISKKDVVDFQKFLNLMKIKFCWRQFFEILTIHNPSLGLREVPQKNSARSVQPFGRFLIQTNRHPNRQAKYIILGFYFSCEHFLFVLKKFFFWLNFYAVILIF